jgi:NADPH:quinone reductase-like Zn-dependent oxidoreductase
MRPDEGDHMKAVIIRGYGAPDVIELADVPVPQPGTGQVRIRVQAAPVHPVDIATRAGRLAEHGLMAASGDVGLGWDLAGVVDALGPGVDRFTTGDMVIGMRDLLTAPVGAQAEQVVLDTDAVAPAPRSVTPVEASTIPLNSLTAAQALDLLALQPGQWLLVTGAAGALGGFALQLAVLRGLRTVAVAAPGDEELVRGLGADEFVARTQAWAARCAASCPPGCTVPWTPGSLVCRPSTPSGTRVRSSRSRPVPRPFRCAARACTTSGSTPTGRGWPSSPLSSTLAS